MSRTCTTAWRGDDRRSDPAAGTSVSTTRFRAESTILTTFLVGGDLRHLDRIVGLIRS
jgi:hypothetical protein